MDSDYTFNVGNQSLKNVYTDNQIDESKLGSTIKSLLFRNHEITIESKVQLETLKYFLEYVINGNLEGYNINNITEFIVLSEEIGKDYVQNTYKSLMNKFSNETLLLDKIINIECESKEKEIIENQISQNLHNYIHQNPEKIRKIPITSLYNIFSNPNRSLTNHDVAYDFIINSAEIEKNQQFYVLIGCLDGTEMSKDKIEDAFYKQDIHQGFVPKIPAHFFSILKNKTEEICQEFSQLKEEQENQFILFQNQIYSLKAEILALKKQRPNKFTKSIEEQQNENKLEEEEDETPYFNEEIEEDDDEDDEEDVIIFKAEKNDNLNHKDDKVKKTENSNLKPKNSPFSPFTYESKNKTEDDLRDEEARKKLLEKVELLRRAEREKRNRQHPNDKQQVKPKVRCGGLLPAPKRRLQNRWKDQ